MFTCSLLNCGLSVCDCKKGEALATRLGVEQHVVRNLAGWSCRGRTDGAQRYYYVDVFILETNPENRTEQIDVQLIHMFLGDKVKVFFKIS